MVSVIFPAAGAGRRMKAGRNKVFLELSGVPILLRSLQRFSAVPAVAELIVPGRRGSSPGGSRRVAPSGSIPLRTA